MGEDAEGQARAAAGELSALQSLFATRLVLAAAEPAATRASVLADVAEWGWRGESEEVPDLLGTDGGEAQAEGFRLSWETVASAGHPDTLARAVLQHPDDEHPGIEWSTAIDVVSAASEVRVSLQIQRRATQMQIAPAPVRLRRPRIVPTLIGNHEASCGDGVALSAIERRLEPADIDAFVGEVLEHPGRALPVLVLATPSGEARPVVNARNLAGELAGLAHVYVLAGQLAWERLHAALGRGSLVPRSGARLFWPGLGGEGDSLRHPFWGRAAIRPRSGRASFERQLFSMLAPLSVLRVPGDPSVPAIRRAHADQRRAELAKRSAERARGEALTGIAKVEDLEEENKTLRGQIDGLQAELEEKESVILVHEENWRTLGIGSPSQEGESERGEDPTEADTWEDVVEICEILADSDAFFLSDRARAQIASCEYPEPARMCQYMVRLSDAAEAFRKAGGQINERFDRWARTRFEIEVSLHDAGLAEAGKGTFEFDGETYNREPHVKVDDAKPASECGRIYFALDTVKKRIIVDHVGLHL